jgi:hypothetical protein
MKNNKTLPFLKNQGNHNRGEQIRWPTSVNINGGRHCNLPTSVNINGGRHCNLPTSVNINRGGPPNLPALVIDSLYIPHPHSQMPKSFGVENIHPEGLPNFFPPLPPPPPPSPVCSSHAVLVCNPTPPRTCL